MSPGTHNDYNFFEKEFLRMKVLKRWISGKAETGKAEIRSEKEIFKNIEEREVFEEIKKYYEANF